MNARALPDAPRHWRVAALLGLAAAASVPLLMPYLLALMPQLRAQVALPLPLFVAAQTAQVGVLLFVAAWFGLRVGYRFGLDAPVMRRLTSDRQHARRAGAWAFAIALGIGVAIVSISLGAALHAVAPATAARHAAPPAWWQGLLASFYGGITEEVLSRLFLVSLFVWLGAGLLKTRQPPDAVYWSAIVLAALLFGVGHLPALAHTAGFGMRGIIRVVGLNAICGIAFGWLFWRRGLEHAMLAHFCADLVLHVAVPLA